MPAKDVRAFALLMQFFVQLFAGFVWFWENVLRPLTTNILWRPFSWAFGKYRKLWDRVVYLKTGHFSYPRAGLMVTASLFALYVLFPVLQFTRDATAFAITAKHETVYLNRSQEIYPDLDIHSVSGCSELPCTDENAIYWRVRPHYFHQVWSIMVGKGLFYPDYVAGAVPNTTSKCEIFTYGMRQPLFTRYFGMYPDILSVKCEALK